MSFASPGAACRAARSPTTGTPTMKSASPSPQARHILRSTRGARGGTGQIIRVGERLADWQAATEFAAKLSEVDPAKLAIWGYSLSGGHVFRVAARNPQFAAAIADAPGVDGDGLVRGRAQVALVATADSDRAGARTSGLREPLRHRPDPPPRATTRRRWMVAPGRAVCDRRRLLDFGHDTSSLIMALLALAAVGCYATALELLVGTNPREFTVQFLRCPTP